MKKILIAGGSGLIGQRLTSILLDKGYTVGVLTRTPKESNIVKQFHWNSDKSEIDTEVLSYNYLVNLAGEGIANKPWTTRRKKKIIESRVKSIELLHKTFLNSGKTLKAIVSASAIGYYGNSGNMLVTEGTPPQTDEFLVDVCKQWELAAKTLEKITPNLSIVRIGTVLSSKGGALPKLAMTVKYGLASYLGSGDQWMSWIHIDDICEQIVYLLKLGHKGGTYNGVSPEFIRNREFTKHLRSRINKNSFMLQTPEFVVRIIMGELANLLFNSNKISSEKIRDIGYKYKYDTLEKALNNIYKK